MNATTITTYLLIAAFALAFLLLWAGSIALVSWDTRRRKLVRWQRGLWIALPVALPLAGFIAYWMILLISRFSKPAPQAPENPKRRMTQPMPALRTPGVRTTIPAAEMVQETVSFSTPEPGKRSKPTARRRVYRVAVLEGPNTGGNYRLDGFPAGIGRSSSSLILLDKDLQVSRKHAEIYEVQETLHIRDLGSLHGTKVNGLPIQDHPLSSEDRIQLGSSVLVFKASEE